MSRDQLFSVPGTWFLNSKFFDGNSDERSGSVIDYKFRRLSRPDSIKQPKEPSGWRNPTEWSVRDSTLEGWDGSISTVYDHGRTKDYEDWNVSGALSSYLPEIYFTPPNFNGSNTLNEVITRALLKVRDQKVNLALAIAESQKSIDMIQDRAYRLAHAYRSFRSGNPKRALDFLGAKGTKKQANSWLEYQYGWMPLLSDIHGSYEQATRNVRQKGHLFKVIATKSLKENPSDIIWTNNSDGHKTTCNQKIVRKTKVALWYTVENPYSLTASEVGLVDPLTLAWELIPWSFVWDWAMPVGDFLSSLTSTVGCTFKGGTVTQTSENTYTGTFTGFNFKGDPNGRNNIRGSGSASTSGRAFAMSRTVLKESPIPNVYIKNPLSAMHAANAVALLRSNSRL